MLKIDDIMNTYGNQKTYTIDETVKTYFKYVQDKKPYVSPTFREEKADRRVSSKNPSFILFSAPGATGKSALAKHISRSKGAIYWDLAGLTIGNNTFVGTLVTALGANRFTEFMEDLKKGKALLAIDAFDETEMVSGKQMVNTFLDEMSKSLIGIEQPSVFLFARTETAAGIVEHCREKEISIRQYEIDFFDEASAKEFIRIFAYPEVEITSAQRAAINESYNVIKNKGQSFFSWDWRYHVIGLLSRTPALT